MGGKDRHSKVSTVRGLRDRRVRLSVQTAIQVYDLQERLGLSQPSKVVDWLLDAAQKEIDKLPPLNFPPHFPHHVGNSGGNGQDYNAYSSISTTLRKEDDRRHRDGHDVGVEIRERGRGVHPLNSAAVSYQHLAFDHNVLSNGLNSVMAVRAQPKSAGSYYPVTNNGCYNQQQPVAPAEPPSGLSLRPVLGGPNFHTSPLPQGMLSFYTPGTIAMIHAKEDHFHSSLLCTTTATGATSPAAAALQSYLLSTNPDSFSAASAAAAVAAPPSSIGRLLS